MLEHPVVQEVLVDRGQLVLELGVEMDDDLRIAFHGLRAAVGANPVAGPDYD